MTDPTAFIRAAMPLCDTLGIAAPSLTAERVELSMEWSNGLCTSDRLLHGGVLMALADSALCASQARRRTRRSTRARKAVRSYSAAVSTL